MVLNVSRATHVLTTPALWDLIGPDVIVDDVPHLRVLALGGAPFPHRMQMYIYVYLCVCVLLCLCVVVFWFVCDVCDVPYADWMCVT